MSKKQRTFPQKAKLFLKGLAMGGANKIPGVSGGMIAFVLGFYEDLIFTFRRINKTAFKLLLKGKFKIFLRYTNMQFLSLIMLGSMCSYFSLSLIIDYFIKNHETNIWSWFCNAIIAYIFINSNIYVLFYRRGIWINFFNYPYWIYNWDDILFWH